MDRIRRPVRSWLIAAGIALMAVGLFSPATARAQDRRSDDSLTRAQKQVRARFQSLISKMKRITVKLDREGRTYAANLLRRAIEEAEAPEIREKLESAETSIDSDALFQAHKLQIEIVEFLDDILALLQDREKEKKIRDAIEKIQAAMKRLDDVRSQEQDLLEDTDSLNSELSESAPSDPEVARSIEDIEELINGQKGLMDELSSEQGSPAEGLEKTWERLGSLLEDQKKLADSLSGDGPKASEKPIDSILEGLLPLLTEQRESIEGFPREPGSKERNNALAEAARARANAASELADKAAEAAAAEESNQNWVTGGQMRKMEDHLRQAAEALEDAADSVEAPDWREAEYSQNRAITEMEKAWNLGEQVRNEGSRGTAESALEQEDLAQRGGSVSRSLERLARSERGGSESPQDGSPESGSQESGNPQSGSQQTGSQQSGSQKPQDRGAALEQASEAARDATNKMQSAAKRLRAGETDPELQEEIVENLEKAVEAMRELRDEARAKERESLARLKPGQEELAERADDAQQSLEQSASQSGESPTTPFLEKASELTKEAAEFMKSAGGALGQSDRQDARANQRLALDRLQEAKGELQQASAAPNEEQRERFRRLTRRQEEIEKAAEELANAQKDIPGNRGESGALAKAREAMEQAQRMLQRSRGSEAADREEEAVKRLNQAQRELEQQEREYIGLQQEELLFRLKGRLTKIRDEQAEIHEKTGSLEKSRVQNGGRFTRIQKLRDLKQLHVAETDLRAEVTGISTAIEEREDSPVFVWYLEQTSLDMDTAAELLKNHDTGFYTQGIEASIVEKLQGMIDDLDDELDRRREEQESDQDGQNQDEEGGGNQGGPERPRLVPHLAELKMIRRMQEEVFRRREEFLEDNPDLGEGELSEIQKIIINRILHQQGSVTEMFQRFKEKLTGSP